MIDLNKTLLRCPYCHWPAVIELESIHKGNQIESRVRCPDCGGDYLVTWDSSKTHELSAEEELALWRG